MRRRIFTTPALATFTLFLCILLLPSAGAQRRPEPAPPINGHPSLSIPCCGRKPPLREIPTPSTYASFTGQIAVATHFANNGTKPSVVIWDLKNQATAPVGSQWDSTDNPPTNTYSHASWARSNIGDVFGLTLDSSGNIYVASTRVYGTGNLGATAITPGTPGSGDIYRLDSNSGFPSRFVQTLNAPTYSSGSPNKIPNMNTGLGNITYRCPPDGAVGSFYVSNFETGEIYQINPAGQIVSRWDHGLNLPTATPSRPAVADSATPGFTALGRRPWAVQARGNELFYSVWTEDQGRPSSTAANEIWSVGLNAAGGFTGPAKLVVTLPPIGGNYSNPVADISFSAVGNMLLAERSMSADNTTSAHNSRLLEYKLVSGVWTPEPVNKFRIGVFSQVNAAGGCDYDYGVGGRVWATADALIYTPPVFLYGLQGTLTGGGNVANSILIDLDNDVSEGDKYYIGDVEIPCPAEIIPPTVECCDKLAAVPHPQVNLSLDYRTFTITNLKAPVSPICSVDITFTPPPSTGWQGGDLYIDNVSVPTATRFVSPYNRIPNAGATTISAVNTVKFNLGVDYTLQPPWTGTVTFVVNHCDGTKCTLRYGPWTALPPSTVPSTEVFDSSVLYEGRLHALRLQLKRRDRRSPIKWIGFMVGDSKGQIFASSSLMEGRERPAAQVSVEDGGLSRTSVLYAFAQPLKSGETAGPFNLVLSRASDATDAPLIIWTTYDSNGNALETGTITSRGGAPR